MRRLTSWSMVLAIGVTAVTSHATSAQARALSRAERRLLPAGLKFGLTLPVAIKQLKARKTPHGPWPKAHGTNIRIFIKRYVGHKLEWVDVHFDKACRVSRFGVNLHETLKITEGRPVFRSWSKLMARRLKRRPKRTTDAHEFTTRSLRVTVKLGSGGGVGALVSVHVQPRKPRPQPAVKVAHCGTEKVARWIPPLAKLKRKKRRKLLPAGLRIGMTLRQAKRVLRKKKISFHDETTTLRLSRRRRYLGIEFTRWINVTLENGRLVGIALRTNERYPPVAMKKHALVLRHVRAHLGAPISRKGDTTIFRKGNLQATIKLELTPPGPVDLIDGSLSSLDVDIERMKQRRPVSR